MSINFNKSNDLIPVIIQDATNLQVLMLGYMNEAAYNETLSTGLVTFFSRSRNELWTKGATSGNYMHVKKISVDCDEDTLLIQVKADGPACHNGTISCFNESTAKGFLYELETVIQNRIDNDMDTSYTNDLFKKGINKMAQKVGEEAVELIIEAKDNDIDLFQNEAADLLFHLLILLKAKNTGLEAIEDILKQRAIKR